MTAPQLQEQGNQPEITGEAVPVPVDVEPLATGVGEDVDTDIEGN